MTSPKFRRRSRERQAALAGDFPDTGETVTELINRVRPPDWDSRPVSFTGISGAGLPDGDPAALPSFIPAPIPSFTPHDQPGPRDTGPLQRLPRMPRIQERPRPADTGARPADAAIFIWSDLIQQHIMKCGQAHFVAGDAPDGSDDTWRSCQHRHADPTAGHMPFTFEALRVSAWSAGWRLDRFARWACPACQLTPAYHTAAPVTLWAEGAGWARRNGDPDAAKWLAAAAEHDLFRDVLDHAGNGRHRAVPR